MAQNFAGMSNEDVLAWLRQQYGNLGPVQSEYSQSAEGGAAPSMSAGGRNLYDMGNGTYNAFLTDAYDQGGQGGQYGKWAAQYGADGKMIGDPRWVQSERSGSWMDQNGWMIPLAVATYGALSGAGAGAAGAADAGGAGFSGLDAAAGTGTGAATTAGAATAGGAAAGGGGLLSTLSQIGSIPGIGALASAALGAAASGRAQGGTTTSNKEPWAPAQPWLRGLLEQGPQLQAWYEQNPFNAIQKTATQNYLNGVDNFNSKTAPALQDWAGGVMSGAKDYVPPEMKLPGASRRYSGFLDGLLGGSSGGGAGLTGMTFGGGGRAVGANPFASMAPQAQFGQIDWSALTPKFSK